jgi:signal peptidase I
VNSLNKEEQLSKEQVASKKQSRLIREIIETVVLTALMFVVINLAVQNYDVDGPSMEPSLHNQERIMVDKVSYHFRSPARGDVIVFIAPPEPTLNYVKRIIALPGDIITIQDTTVKVNGVSLNEKYVNPGDQGNPYPPIVNQRVPANDYFVMGDDRKNSSDSREWGFVPRANIIGRAALVYWPLNESNSGFLPDASSVFVHVPTATVQPAHSLSTGTTSGSGDMLFFAMPGFFLVCSRYRGKC